MGCGGLLGESERGAGVKDTEFGKGHEGDGRRVGM